MIKQEHFFTKHKFQKHVTLPPNILELPYRESNKLQEKIVLAEGDQLHTHTDEKKKMAWTFVNGQSTTRELFKPRWALRRTAKLADTAFEDIYLTQGVKSQYQDCFYANDAGGNLVCFNLRAFKVGEWLDSNDAHSPQIYSVLDAYQIITLPPTTVRDTFGHHPRYLEFMTLKGWEAQ